MSDTSAVEQTLAAAAAELVEVGRRFALVGGLAVSVRAEVRFTRDVDLAVAVEDDADAEQLVYHLRAVGHRALASVEHETQKRLSTAEVLIRDERARGALVTVLEDQIGHSTPAHLMWAPSQHVSPKLRALIDWMAQRFVR